MMSNDPSIENALSEGIVRLWEKFRPTNLERVSTLEKAVASLLDGRLDAEQRRLAEREAHKLAGGVGTYGFARASQLARRCEEILAGTEPLLEGAVLRLSDAVVQLRDELDVERPARPPRAAAPPNPGRNVETPAEPGNGRRPILVLAALPDDYRDRVIMEAEGRGWEVHNAGQGRRFSNAVLLIDLDEIPASHREEALHRLHLALPAVPIVALSEAGDFRTRLFAARKGVHRFGQKPISPPQAVALVEAAREVHVGTMRRVLVVDDDPQVTAAAQHHLGGRGIETHAVHSADSFWTRLEELQPDLVLFDADLPRISGLDACRMLRADREWQHIPILLLSGNSDTATITEVFEAGADDFISKPLVGPELVARVENWIDRVRLARAAGAFEPSSGLLRRAVATGEIERVLAIAQRHGARVSFAWVQLKGIAADRLREIGRRLQSAMRDEDLLSRWSGEEILVALYDTGEKQARERVQRSLAEAGGDFEVGTATWPHDGDTLDDLHDVACTRLERTGAGPTSDNSPSSSDAGRVDVIVIEDDEALAGLLLHSLEVAGYTTSWIEDGQDAVDALTGSPPGIRGRVILLDIDLPGRDGISVLRELVRSDALESSRVIVLTRRAGEPDVVRALELGATAYVEKPFSLPALLQHIRQAGARG